MEEKISPNPRIAPHNFPKIKVCQDPPGRVCGGNITLGQGCQTHFSSRAAWSKSILTRAGLQISFLKKTSFKKNFSLKLHYENVHITSNWLHNRTANATSSGHSNRQNSSFIFLCFAKSSRGLH